MQTKILVGNHILNTETLTGLQSEGFDRLILLQEEIIAHLHEELLSPLYTIIPESYRLTIKGGESEKGTDTLFRIIDWLQECKATRHTLLIIVGGGAILDMGGFAGSIFKRGLKTLYIPTTLMAMVDASIGGKTAIDYKGIKNLIGAFSLPHSIYSIPNFLTTLAEEEILSGYWEMVKHSLLQSKDEWNAIRSIAPLDKSTDWEDFVRQNINIKQHFVLQDPEDNGVRQYLNLGHTIGHAFEAYSLQQNRNKRKLKHGEAVAFGLICELFISHLRLGFDLGELCNLVHLVRSYHSPYPLVCKEYPKIIQFMKSDKKNCGNAISIIGLGDFGEAEKIEVTEEEIQDAFDFFRETFGQ